jgi:anti-sigma regulatory factor (Ser/Thr protein kinase)
MPIVPRLNQTFDYFTVAMGAEGNLEWTEATISVACRANEGTAIVRDSRGEDIQYDLVLHTNYDTPLEKGNGALIFNNYYLIDDVRVTRDLDGTAFMQFVMLKKTDNFDVILGFHFQNGDAFEFQNGDTFEFN